MGMPEQNRAINGRSHRRGYIRRTMIQERVVWMATVA
jgi:hypothetical protein